MLLPLLYADDQRDGWGEGMRRVTHALLADVCLPDGPLIEVGCGGGQLLAELRRRYPQRAIIGVDLHPLALAHAHAVLRPTVNSVVNSTVNSTVNFTQAALPHLPWTENQAALLLALDVFDQEGVVLAQALAESYRLLRSGGVLVMRVSAHPSLYGPHDRAFHTGQRFRRDQLHSALAQAGFVVQRLTYANFALSLPVALLRLGQRWRVAAWQPELYQHSRLNQAAAWLLCQEAKWLRHADLPWGISLCAVARKP